MASKKDVETKPLQVALSLSGGGYRASVYHLGVLSYLYHLKMDDGSRLLDHVRVMSTISGGSITGMWYALHLQDKEHLPEKFQELYDILKTKNLITEVLKRFDGNRNKKAESIIKELSCVYNELFFHDTTFASIIQNVKTGPLQNYAAYSTDMVNRMPFRFHASASKCNDIPFGNEIRCVDTKEASSLRLSDIVAASSCFPLVFEPIRYPRDFIHKKQDKEDELEGLQIDLMDGGILDNQGIDYLLEIEHCISKEFSLKEDKNGIDLAIISDAALLGEGIDSPSRNQKKPWYIKFLNVLLFLPSQLLCFCAYVIYSMFGLFRFCTFIGVQWCVLSLATISFGIGFVNYTPDKDQLKEFIPFCSFLVFAIIWMLLGIGRMKTPKSIKHSDDFEIPKDLIWKIRFTQLYRLGKRRYESFDKMVSTVMMGHIRKINIKILTQSPKWRNRFVIPLISEFSSNGLLKNDPSNPLLLNTDIIKKISDQASKCKTRLWFTEDDIAYHLPEKILACGQYTMCYELLNWIEENQGNKKNLTPVHQQLKALKPVLEEDWIHFKSKPYTFINLGDLK